MQQIESQRGPNKILPLLQWLPCYQSEWLRLDIVAGLTTAAGVIHQAMAYAAIAGLPAEEGEPVAIEGAVVNVHDLLPEDCSSYHDGGSLIAPPCTGVLWHVLAQPVEISADQLAAFRAIHDGTNRPFQPKNDREFFATEAGH